MKRIGIIVLLLPALSLLSFGCSSGDAELTGESAFDYIRKDLSAAPQTDIEAIKEVMDWAIDDNMAKRRLAKGETLAKGTDSSRVEPSERVMAILRKTTKPRKNIDTDAFERIDFSEYAAAVGNSRKRIIAESVDTSKLQSEFYVDHLEAIPVRNQGYRGTCAAFTGTGHIEYATLQKYGNLSTMDLSEQRYYFLSKPECQDGSCGRNEEGSWYGTAMDASAKASGPDIPLEADCPYNSRFEGNDVQSPQLDSCSTGAVQVKKLKYVTGPNEIIDALHETKLPVPFASPLSSNWESNDGLITFAESGYSGSTSHAGGHAYLIVGYKKLPQMPEEGGMCFIVKNSWGTGWGVNGYSCMTLKWVQNWNFGYELSHPVVMEVLLRDDLQNSDELPNNEEAEDESAPDVPDESEEDSSADTDKTDDEVEEEIDNLPEPDPMEELSWTSVKLFGPGESYFRAQVADNNGKLLVRAIVRESTKFTNPVELEKDSAKAGRLIFDGDRVGQLDGEELYLCSGSYDLICSLRFSTEENEIYIEFPYADNRKVKDDELPSGSWSGFDIPFGDYGVQVYQPKDLSWVATNPKGFFRLKKPGGSSTEPVRVSVSGTSIKVMGETVGSLNPSNIGLCTGEFSGKCSMFSLGEELNVLPSW